MNKRVRIATTENYPDGMASTYRIHCYAKGLGQQAILVEVVSTSSIDKYSGRRFNYRSEFDGVPYTIIWNRGLFKSRVFGYVWAEIRSYLLLWHCVFASGKYDVLWLYGMGLIPRLLLIPVLHVLGKRVILEINEYPYGTEGNKLTRIPFVRKVMKWMTLRFVFRQLDGIVVVSENLAALVKQHAPRVPLLKVPILVEPERALFKRGVTEVGNVPHPRAYLFHAGSLSIQKDGIIKVIEAYAKAAVRLRELSFRLDLVLTNKNTFPNVWNAIQQILVDNNLSDHLTITGYLTESELHGYLSHARALIINKPSSFQNKYNFPTKLGDYLLSGRPVIVASEGTELNRYLVGDVNCWIVKPDDVTGMADGLINFCLNPELANIIGAAGRQTALDQFDYRNNSLRVKDFIMSI